MNGIYPEILEVYENIERKNNKIEGLNFYWVIILKKKKERRDNKNFRLSLYFLFLTNTPTSNYATKIVGKWK